MAADSADKSKRTGRYPVTQKTIIPEKKNCTVQVNKQGGKKVRHTYCLMFSAEIYCI
jgi:plasmid rolling circle replication initiator protein Rep